MGRFSDRWKEFIDKVKLIQPDGIKQLFLVGLYIIVVSLILIDSIGIITPATIVGVVLIAMMGVTGLVVSRLHE